MKSEQQEAYTEVLTILNYMNIEYKERIPNKLIEFFKKNSAKDYNFHIDLAIPLKEQNLKDKTLSLLAMLNLNYWCNNDEEKQELINIYSQNERKYQEELRKKYNPDNIFKNHIKENNINNEVSLVEYKEPLLKRIINKIKSFLMLLIKE